MAIPPMRLVKLVLRDLALTVLLGPGQFDARDHSRRAGTVITHGYAACSTI